MDKRRRVIRSLPLPNEEYKTKRELGSMSLCPPLPVPVKCTRRTPQKYYSLGHCSPKPVYYVRQNALSPMYSSDNTKSYFDQIFTKTTKIGEGSFGEVYRVQSREDSKLYAVKQFKTNHLTKYAYAEVRNYEKIGEHKNFVKFYLAWEELQIIYIQMEYCRISLAQYGVLKHNIEEKQLWEVLYDLLNALDHLHSQKLIHLDVKSDNIMMSNGFYKLADFGLLVDLNEHNGKKISTISDGDAKYLACEVLAGVYTYACDIFGLGISILELATNIQLPESGPLWHQIRKQLPSSLYNVVTTELSTTLEQMMLYEHSERPSAANLLKCHNLKEVKKRDRKGLRSDYIVDLPDNLQESSSSSLLAELYDNNNIVETPRRPPNDNRKLTHSGQLGERMSGRKSDTDIPRTPRRGLRIKLTF